MIAIDEETRRPVSLVLKEGTDRLMVDAAGVTLTAEQITLDVSGIESRLDDIKAQNDDIIALLTTIATNTTPE